MGNSIRHQRREENCDVVSTVQSAGYLVSIETSKAPSLFFADVRIGGQKRNAPPRPLQILRAALRAGPTTVLTLRCLGLCSRSAAESL